jgi:glycosyltransferase involved in cell wall biosynthesis
MISNKFLISIIVPIYNSEKYLENSLNSLIFQTYKNLEIILIDDNSTDNSFSVCEKFQKKDSRIKLIKLEKNHGQSVARNIGLLNCTGQIISFFDSDDILDKNFVSFLLNFMLQNNLDVASTPITYKINNLGKSVYNEDHIFPDKFHILNEFLNGKFIHSGPCNKLYLYEKIKGIFFPPDRKAREDIFFLIDVFERIERLGIIKETLYQQTLHGMSIENGPFSIHKMNFLNYLTIFKDKFISIYPNLLPFFYKKEINEYKFVLLELLKKENFFKNKPSIDFLTNKLRNLAKINKKSFFFYLLTNFPFIFWLLFKLKFLFRILLNPIKQLFRC